MPSFTTILALTSMATSTLAITLTSPTKFQLWDSSKSNTVSWSSVNTDPSKISIYLAHMAAHPPLYSLLFSDVDTSSGSVVVEGLQLPNGEAYQINLVANDNDQQILAQSQQFNVTGEAVDATSTLAGYTGPTHTPSASGSSESKTESGSETSTTKTAAVQTTVRTLTSTGTDSEGATVTRTSTSTGTNTAEPTETGSSDQAQETESGTGTAGSAAPTTTPNAAASNFVASGSVAALFLGVAAFLV